PRVAPEREALARLAAHESVERPLCPGLPMTGSALAGVDGDALGRRAAPGRQPGPVRHDVDVPRPDLCGGSGPPKAVARRRSDSYLSLLRSPTRATNEGQRDNC